MDSLVQRIQTALEILGRNMEQTMPQKIPITKPQFITLYTIHTYKNCRLSQLAEKMEVKPSAITVMINRLERENLVKRIHDPDDRRAVIVSLTSIGEDVLKQVMEEWNNVLKQYLVEFKIEEVQMLTELIEKLAGIKTNKD